MINGLPERLQQLRQKYGLSQKAVADRLGISTSIISGYEVGIRTPSVEMLYRLSGLYHCSTDFLLGKSAPTDTLDVSGLTEEQVRLLERLIENMK